MIAPATPLLGRGLRPVGRDAKRLRSELFANQFIDSGKKLEVWATLPKEYEIQ